MELENKCDKGWRTGECCCNCKNQIELFKHPWNLINKGPISESTGMYACIASLDCDGKNEGVILERKHGFCELYVKR